MNQQQEIYSLLFSLKSLPGCREIYRHFSRRIVKEFLLGKFGRRFEKYIKRNMDYGNGKRLLFLWEENTMQCIGSNIIAEWAAQFGYIHIVKPLIESDLDQEYAFKSVCKYGQIDILKLILKLKKYNNTIENGIMDACYHGHYEIFMLILEKFENDITVWYSCMYGALKSNNLQILKTLFDKHLITNAAWNDNYAITFATRKCSIDIVTYLLQRPEVNPSVDNNRCIRDACSDGNLEIVNMLLVDDRVDPSANENDAIQNASKNGHYDVVKRLLEDDRVDPFDCQDYAIDLAKKMGYDDIVSLLLGKKIKI
jgi:ankyrin repeat protein